LVWKLTGQIAGVTGRQQHEERLVEFRKRNICYRGSADNGKDSHDKVSNEKEERNKEVLNFCNVHCAIRQLAFFLKDNLEEERLVILILLPLLRWIAPHLRD
jgi:hypothetical protein